MTTHEHSLLLDAQDTLEAGEHLHRTWTPERLAEIPYDDLERAAAAADLAAVRCASWASKVQRLRRHRLGIPPGPAEEVTS